MSHVFISYVREDSDRVDRLRRGLSQYGIDVWLDRTEIRPGQRWQDAIRQAIRGGAFFIACFSPAYASRAKSYMNEELSLAIAELRQYSPDQIWFIPVLLADCEVPDRSIGPGESLRDLNWVELFRDWDSGVRRIATVVAPDPLSQSEERYFMPDLDEDAWELLVRRIGADQCLPILGSGINVSLLRESDLATRLAARHNITGGQVADLAWVAQRIEDQLGDRLMPKEEIAWLLERPPAPAEGPEEIHATLALLPVSVYLTTAYDDHLESALSIRGRRPFQDFYSVTSGKWKSVLDEDVSAQPTVATPWVVHLRGAISDLESLVLTDRDHLRLLNALRPEPYALHHAVEARLRMTTHLFLGFRRGERLTELVCEGLTREGLRRLRFTPVADDDAEQALDHFGRHQRGVIALAEFVRELRSRWSRFSDEAGP